MRSLSGRCAKILFLSLLSIPVARKGDAVPAFARKYQTSCQTCHQIFPKLNPFGQAFRLNGYHLPGETEDQVKVPPVSLGSEAYERVWPKMVWPGDIPGSVPLALNVKMASLYSSSHGEDGAQVVRNDFQFPQEVNLFGAGTLGRGFSFFGELTYAELPGGATEVEIEHARLDWLNVVGPDHLVNVRVGKMAPNAWDGFQEMWIMTDNAVDSLFGYNPIGLRGGAGLGEEGAGVGLPALVRGIEVWGVAAHRLFYTVGVGQPVAPAGAGGSFGNGGKKDFWARVDWKFGGMGLDGSTAGRELPPENWRETSFRLGVFGYTGDGEGIDFNLEDDAGTELRAQDLRYDRVGVYASLLLGDLNLFGAAVHGTDRLQLREAASGTVVDEARHSFDAWFAQADYVIAPPFQISARYEHLRPADPQAESVRFLNANVSFLARANLKLMLEYRRDLADSDNYTLATVLRFAY